MTTAKIFWSGNSQAVRLPKDFRFPPGSDEVEIQREGDHLVLRAIQCEDWPDDFWQAFDGMSDDFERPAQVRQQREGLD